MTRADEFRSFMKECRGIDESIDFLPEIPDPCDIGYLNSVVESDTISDNPYEPSEIRKSGLKIWDSVYLPMPKQISMLPKRPKDLSSLRSINDEWERTKETLGMIGRPDGVHYIRPKGPHILDIMNDDLRMLQGAHIITHRTPVDLQGDDYTFGQLSDLFLRNLIKLFIAREFDLAINVHPERASEDSFSLYGIEVFGSSTLRAPSLLSATKGQACRLEQDNTVVAILGSVGIEPCPRQAKSSDDWREINKWSCLPTLVALAGWECVDYVTHVERVDLNGDTYYGIPCSDLQPMSKLRELLDIAKEARGVPEINSSTFTVKEWLESDDFVKGLSVTPQLPCPHCIRINSGSGDVVLKPHSRKPRKTFKEIAESKVPELSAWASYVSFMRNCISIGRTATAYALGSVTSVESRNRAFKKRAEKIKRVSSLSKKYWRKANNGFLSEAAAIRSKIEILNKELEQ